MTFADPSVMLLFAVLAGALGGMGGRWIAMRAISRRIDALSEDLDGVTSILRKRAGRQGVEKREAEKKIELDEMELLRQAAAAEKRGRKPARAAGPPTDADAERAFSDDGPRLVQVGEE